VPSNLFVTVTATSVAHPSKSSSIGIAMVAIAVTIQNKVTELAAGTGNYFSALFSASVQNDPNHYGVTWTLTANGVPCSPACGTLFTIDAAAAQYTPPSSVPAAPDNTPTITAASATNPGRSDSRSEEHTSELQSHLNLVCRLLLEKKKDNTIIFS